MVLYGNENFAAESFQIFLKYLLSGPHKNAFGIFEILNWNFNEFYSFSLTWDLMGAKISKRYSSYKSQPNVLKLVLNVSPNGPHKTTVWIFEIFNFWFLGIFFQNSKFTIVTYGEIKNLNYLEHEPS